MCEDSTIFLNNQAFRWKIGFLVCFSRKLLTYEHFPAISLFVEGGVKNG